MAALTVQTVTGAGVEPSTPVQITAWSGTGDTLTAGQLGERGVVLQVANDSGGPLDLRINDSGRTPAGNPVALGYETHTIADGDVLEVLVTKESCSTAGVVKIGASTSNAAFTVRALRY
jgi:hypothetical protein